MGPIAQLITVWGSLGKGPEQLNEPEDIAVDNKGQIYVMIHEILGFKY